MGKFIKIKKDDIEQVLQGVSRQYLVGNLKRPQELEFIRTEQLEIGITDYDTYTTEPVHYHTQAYEYQYMISGWTIYMDVETGIEYEFKQGDFYCAVPGTTYAQKSKEGTRILFIKVPSIDDKHVVETSDAIRTWYDQGLKTIRKDYAHEDQMPAANSMKPAAAVTIKQLETFEEKIEAERLIATSFLHEWKQEEAEESARNPKGEAWAAYDQSGHMVTALTTLAKEIIYEGNAFSCSELHMIGTLPEARGKGAVRNIMDRVLREYKARGDLFTFLIPFSFVFYRKYGFELASEIMIEKAVIDQFAGFHQDMTASQIKSQSQVDEAHKLYDAYIRSYNLAEIKDGYCWTYNENQEFGQRDWQNADKPHYSYLFFDKDGQARAYFTFLFIHGPEGPFTGMMKVTELIYDSPEALENVFAFFYSMRAKIKEIELELPRDMDLSYILPECDKVKRGLDGHMTARALNIDKILQAMDQPQGKGRYSIHITDTFLPENTGTYRVDFEDGKALKIVKNEEAADIDLTVETFCQLSVGLIDLDQAMYRPGTRLNKNKRWLKETFVRKPLFLC